MFAKSHLKGGKWSLIDLAQTRLSFADEGVTAAW